MQMVNVWFPEQAGYGFEMVDATGASSAGVKPPSIENLRRIQSVGFFANFERFNRDANTFELSTTGSQEPIARSTATKA
jgi:hypothetical protein